MNSPTPLETLHQKSWIRLGLNNIGMFTTLQEFIGSDMVPAAMQFELSSVAEAKAAAHDQTRSS
ncbi:hypothetical protein [Mycobacterium basiliense]|uniref:hypothetical protein n=1 Tax=Mycobacterium basiliense TaxID=2094119 RepID=UPI0013010F4D|nr:hypothetical protein [Mycobacterium basiliense]